MLYKYVIRASPLRNALMDNTPIDETGFIFQLPEDARDMALQYLGMNQVYGYPITVFVYSEYNEAQNAPNIEQEVWAKDVADHMIKQVFKANRPELQDIVTEAEKLVSKLMEQYGNGLITPLDYATYASRYWNEARNKMIIAGETY